MAAQLYGQPLHGSNPTSCRAHEEGEAMAPVHSGGLSQGGPCARSPRCRAAERGRPLVRGGAAAVSAPGSSTRPGRLAPWPLREETALRPDPCAGRAPRRSSESLQRPWDPRPRGRPCDGPLSPARAALAPWREAGLRAQVSPGERPLRCPIGVHVEGEQHEPSFQFTGMPVPEAYRSHSGWYASVACQAVQSIVSDQERP